jgi:hypothetical protein
MTEKLIKNISKIPYLCVNCKYLKRDSIFCNTTFARCTRFYEIDVVSGRKKYDYASISRNYKCEEKYFEKKKTLIEKISELFSVKIATN